MACSSSIEILNSIKTILENQIIDETSILRPYGVWTEKRKGKHVVYEYTHTYTAASTVNIDLDFLKWASIKRIDQIWNDGTAKTVSVRMMTDQAGVYYSEIDSVSADTNTSIVISPTIENEFMVNDGSRLRFAHSSYTQGRIVKTVVVVDEL